jgi:phosphate transport system ATP-binding protein
MALHGPSPATGPEVLLADEPVSALGPKSTAAIEELIGELKRQLTVVIFTHDMPQADRGTNDTAFFFEGPLIDAGTTKRIFNSPRESRTLDSIAGRFG